MLQIYQGSLQVHNYRRVTALQELVQIDAPAAEVALHHFQSCVRTLLLVSNGYECQEKVCTPSMAANAAV